MSNINEITGDKLQSKVGNPEAYDTGWDRIFESKSVAKRVATQLDLPMDTFLSSNPIAQEDDCCSGVEQPSPKQGCCGGCH